MKFQTFWGGRRISPYEVLCLRSFTSVGHEIDLYTYDLGMPVLPGVTICDANELLSSKEYSENTEYFIGHPGIFSDHFRYKLLYELGGWWIDMDVLLIGTPSCQALCFAYQDENLVNNAIMRFPSHHPTMLSCLLNTARLRKLGGVVWGDTGPNLLTSVLDYYGLLHFAAGKDNYYPLSFMNIFDVFDPEKFDEVKRKLESATFLHLWNVVLTEHGVDKLSELKEGSWLRKEADRLLGKDEWQIWRDWNYKCAL